MRNERAEQHHYTGTTGRLIGLTGGIATGKSTVGALLVEQGAVLVDADDIAHKVDEPGSTAYREIVGKFGDSILLPDGRINRQALGRLVFHDPGLRLALEEITHPEIGLRLFSEIREQQEKNLVVVADIPLLFERNYQTIFDGVLLAWCPEELQIERICSRDGLSATEALQRIRAQMPVDEKRALASWVIDTSQGLAQTRSQALLWWQAITNELGRSPRRS